MSSVLDHDGLQWIIRNAEARINELHLSMEAPGMEEWTTHAIRGQIMAYRRAMEDANKAYRDG